MTSHELARILLAGDDILIVDEGYYDVYVDDPPILREVYVYEDGASSAYHSLDGRVQPPGTTLVKCLVIGE